MPQPMPQMAQVTLVLIAVFFVLMLILAVVLFVIELRNERAAREMRKAQDDITGYRRAQRAELYHKVRAATREANRDPKHRMHRNPGGGTAA